MICFVISLLFCLKYQTVSFTQKTLGLTGTAATKSWTDYFEISDNTASTYLPLQYSANEITNYYSKRPFLVWERLVDIGSPILGWWILKKFDSITAPFRTEEENIRIINERAADLKDAMVQGKSVTVIKSGQALALRPDLVKSKEYIRELQKLQDEVGTFEEKVAFKIMEDELGSDPSSIFDFVSTTPVASASIGQVYKARLRDSGAAVAVKVQRPDALSSAALDMFILRIVAALVKRLKKLRSDLVGVTDQFGSQLFSELNYNQEALNCLRFKELYGNIPGIYVPTAYTNLTRQRVLTMEWVDGVKGPWKEGGERMLTVGLQCSVMQVLDTGFFHSDPHRGNLLKTPDDKLAYLDFGMMAEVPSRQRFALIGTVLGLVNKDISLVITSLKKLNFFPPEADTNTIVTALDSAINNSIDQGEVSSLNFTKLNANLNAISDILPFRLPPFYSLIIRTLTILEGLALAVDSEFRLIRGAYPFIAKQILTSNSPELKILLQTVLINSEGKIRWDKLEQFVSIASNADLATRGDFSALKRAQDRSDLIKTYSGNRSDGNFTVDTTILIMDFLVSDNGRFLRDPLVDEVVESLDNLGLTAATVMNLLSGNLFPTPPMKPDRQKAEQLVKVLTLFVGVVQSALEKNIASRGKNELTSEFVSMFPGLTLFISLIEQLVEVTSPSGEETLIASKLQILLSRVSSLLLQVLTQLAQLNVRRAARNLFNTERVKGFLPLLARVLDLQSSLTP